MIELHKISFSIPGDDVFQTHRGDMLHDASLPGPRGEFNCLPDDELDPVVVGIVTHIDDSFELRQLMSASGLKPYRFHNKTTGDYIHGYLVDGNGTYHGFKNALS